MKIVFARASVSTLAGLVSTWDRNRNIGRNTKSVAAPGLFLRFDCSARGEHLPEGSPA